MNEQRGLVGWARFAYGAAILCCASVLLVGCPQINPGGGGNGNGNGNDNGNDNGSGGPTDEEIRNKAFVGAANCAQCHPGAHDDWSATLHAGALETLEAIGQGSNANCLGCHTVGFGQTDGYTDRTNTNYLVGVQCENCHGAGGQHLRDPLNKDFTPPVSIGADVCGQCHQGSHHPNFEQWTESAHSEVNESVAEDLLEGGAFVNNCGQCHSGDVFYRSRIKGETVAEDAFVALTAEDLQPITCVICHNPHARTNNAAAPDTDRDYQLRFRQAASPTPSNTVEDAINPARFNLCGQCHHSRGRTWQTTSREPHHSLQANLYAGEMPLPEDDPEPLVLSRVSVHSFAVEQCSTCHMYRQDFESEEAPAISGHNFTVNNAGCATSGCHPSNDAAVAAQAILQTEVETRLDGIAARLGDPATWEYTAGGGPDADGQALLSNEIKKIRFLLKYIANDGSLGVHNPDYVRSMLDKAEEMLDDIGS